MPSFIRKVCFGIAFTCTLLNVLDCREANAQYMRYRYYGPLYTYPVGTAFSAQVHAQADLIRSYGSYQVDEAYARRVRAEAVKQEIANSVAYVRAKYEIQAIHDAQRALKRFNHQKAQQHRNSKRWRTISELPELLGVSIPKGTALNFLLTRLSTTNILATQFSTEEGKNELIDFDSEALLLDEALLDRILVMQKNQGGKNLEFYPLQGEALLVDWWPWAIRSESDLEGLCNDFELARTEAVEACVLARSEADEFGKQKRIDDGIRKLLVAHQELNEAFNRKYTKEYKFRDKSKSFFEYLEADRFLDGLAAQIARMQATGDASAFDGRLKFEGKNLIEFLTYMSSNGLQFHEAKPGNEAAYHKLFELMRDVYATVADEDPGVQPTYDGKPTGLDRPTPESQEPAAVETQQGATAEPVTGPL